MNKELQSIAEAYVGMLTEGKMLKTHLPSGKPNPSHPAYSKHKEAYDAARTEEKAAEKAAKPVAVKPAKQAEENPVKFHHIENAISSSFPDTEPYEHLARQFPQLHKATGVHGSKLTDLANKAVKEHTKHKTLSAYADASYAEMHKDKE